MISPRAHIHLTRSSSAPSDLSPSSARKRRRPSTPSIPSVDSAEDEDEERNLNDIQSTEDEEEDVDEELRHITRQPLSILISPLVCKERPHCPVPLSPSTSSLSSSDSRMSVPSPRRPLFVNQLLTMGTASALIITPSSSTASSSTSTSSAFSFPTPAPHDRLTAPISRALSIDPILQRTRSAWRREYERRDRVRSDIARPLLPLRRIVPCHVGPEVEQPTEEEQVEGEERRESRKRKKEEEATPDLPPVSRIISGNGNKRVTCEAPSNKRRLQGGGRKRVGAEQSLIVDFFTSRTSQQRAGRAGK